MKQLTALKKKWLCSLIGMMNGLPSSKRKEFVKHMQLVKTETIQRAVNNGITLETLPKFSHISFPIVALAGSKEQEEIISSVKQIAELNPHCRYEIWEKARHNIPPVFASRFNRLICELVR
ncbi:MAG: hypothetical protein IJU92_05225 [Spirochaetaceae bacterium]|nr:hypothetical protein [Spirochaetaceae bacterium]